MDRRQFIVKSGKVLITCSILGTGLLSLTGCSSNKETKGASNEGASTEGTSKEQPLSAPKKILVAYFSYTGNTREIANQIHERVDSDIFEIRTVDPYSSDSDTVLDQAKKEQKDNYRPKIATEVENIDSYNVVFIGYPIWWEMSPMAVFTFLEGHDFSGKTIVPFCTHDGSVLGRSIADITKICSQSTILDALAVRGKGATKAKDEVSKWLRKIKMIE